MIWALSFFTRMTLAVKYVRTFSQLRAELLSWEDVLEAPGTRLEELLKDLRLAQTKARHLRGILAAVREREGRLSIDRLRGLSDARVEAHLAALPGVPEKKVRCLVLCALGRQKCPVDTHVWRITQHLGLTASGPWSDRGGRELEASTPARRRASLHVTLVEHGRRIYGTRTAESARCASAELCPNSSALDGSQL